MLKSLDTKNDSEWFDIRAVVETDGRESEILYPAVRNEETDFDRELSKILLYHRTLVRQRPFWLRYLCGNVYPTEGNGIPYPPDRKINVTVDGKTYIVYPKFAWDCRPEEYDLSRAQEETQMVGDFRALYNNPPLPGSITNILKQGVRVGTTTLDLLGYSYSARGVKYGIKVSREHLRDESETAKTLVHEFVHTNFRHNGASRCPMNMSKKVWHTLSEGRYDALGIEEYATELEMESLLKDPDMMAFVENVRARIRPGSTFIIKGA